MSIPEKKLWLLEKLFLSYFIRWFCVRVLLYLASRSENLRKDLMIHEEIQEFLKSMALSKNSTLHPLPVKKESSFAFLFSFTFTFMNVCCLGTNRENSFFESELVIQACEVVCYLMYVNILETHLFDLSSGPIIRPVNIHVKYQRQWLLVWNNTYACESIQIFHIFWSIIGRKHVRLNLRAQRNASFGCKKRFLWPSFVYIPSYIRRIGYGSF